MKSLTMRISVVLLLGMLLAYPVSAATLKFDVGRDDTAGNINGITWLAQDVANAVDTTGALTGISLTVTSATGFNEAGPNDSGTSTPGLPASAFFVGDTTNDALFGHSSNFNVGAPRALVEYTIAGLNNALTYDFTFYASRGAVGDNREAQYDVAGTNSGQALLDAGNNVSNIAQVLGIAPNAGSITLTIQKGPNNTNGSGFFYLGGMQISAVPEPASMLLFSLGGLAIVVGGRKQR